MRATLQVLGEEEITVKLKCGVVGIAALSLVPVAGCGGPKTQSGVAFEKKSASDVAKLCESRMGQNVDIYRMRRDISDRDKKKIVSECCKPVKAAAGKLDDLQRAYLWYDWAAKDDLNQTPNEVEALREVRSALRGDLTPPKRSQAAQIQTTANICGGRMADRI